MIDLIESLFLAGALMFVGVSYVIGAILIDHVQVNRYTCDHVEAHYSKVQCKDYERSVKAAKHYKKHTGKFLYMPEK